ncbi:TPA: LOW QUALITY PROTEIN: hypothetical protein N0F65_007434, partial [Lagenidium giganteum]
RTLRDELLVIRRFAHEIMGGNLRSYGAVITSRSLLACALQCIRDQKHEVSASADATYNLHSGGWALASIGTSTVNYENKGGTHWVHRFTPWAFMFVLSKSTQAYIELFEGVKRIINERFEEDLNVRYASMDHSSAIQDAFTTALFNNLSEPQLQCLPQARSKAQLHALWRLLRQHWEDVGPHDFADWFENQYMNDIGARGASRPPDIVPNQNAIEAYHRGAKTSAVTQLRASTARVLNITIPAILRYSGGINENTGVICESSIPGEMLREAHLLCEPSNHPSTKSNKTKAANSYLFNARPYILDANVPGLNGLAPDKPSAKVYLQSLRGRLRPGEASAHAGLDLAERFSLQQAYDTSTVVTAESTINQDGHVVTCCRLLTNVCCKICSNSLQCPKCRADRVVAVQSVE